MNRSPINGSALGAGAFRSTVWSRVTDALQLVGSLRTSLTKSGAAVTALALSGSLKATQRVSASLAAVVSLSGRLSASVWQRVYGASVQFMGMESRANPSIEVSAQGSVEALLAGILIATIRRRVFWNVAQDMALTGSLLGFDLNTGFAPVDRITTISGALRLVAVPGTETSTGV